MHSSHRREGKEEMVGEQGSCAFPEPGPQWMTFVPGAPQNMAMNSPCAPPFHSSIPLSSSLTVHLKAWAAAHSAGWPRAGLPLHEPQGEAPVFLKLCLWEFKLQFRPGTRGGDIWGQAHLTVGGSQGFSQGTASPPWCLPLHGPKSPNGHGHWEGKMGPMCLFPDCPGHCDFFPSLASSLASTAGHPFSGNAPSL